MKTILSCFSCLFMYFRMDTFQEYCIAIRRFTRYPSQQYTSAFGLYIWFLWIIKNSTAKWNLPGFQTLGAFAHFASIATVLGACLSLRSRWVSGKNCLIGGAAKCAEATSLKTKGTSFCRASYLHIFIYYIYLPHNIIWKNNLNVLFIFYLQNLMAVNGQIFLFLLRYCLYLQGGESHPWFCLLLFVFRKRGKVSEKQTKVLRKRRLWKKRGWLKWKKEQWQSQGWRR